jgi:iron complex transport system substrate-binding protein
MGPVPQRIVSLQPSITVVLRELDALDALVGCTKYCADLCPQVGASKIAIVSDSWSAQASQIADLRPDLVIASVPYQEKSIAEIMKAGARFLGLAPKSLAGIYGDIALIAAIVNLPEKGTQLIHAMQRSIAAVHSQTRSLPRPRVFCEEWGKPLIISQLWVAELVEAAGGEFIGKHGAQISPEEVQALAPEVCIAA